MSRGMQTPTFTVAVAVAAAALVLGGRAEAAESEYEIVRLTTGEVPRAGACVFGLFLETSEISGDAADVRTTQLRAELSWGLGGSTEIELRLPHNWRTTESDLPGPARESTTETTDETGDAEVLLKMSMATGSGNAAMGVRVSPDTNADDSDPVTTLFVAATIETGQTDVHVYVGARLVEDQDTVTEYALGAGIRMDRRTMFLLGLEGEDDGNGNGGTSGNLGVQWSLTGPTVSVGLGFGLDDDAEDWELRAGVEWRF